MNSPYVIRRRLMDRFIVYLPLGFRGHAKLDRGPIMRMSQQSRPAYRVLDTANKAKGNCPELPFHVLPAIMADKLDYLAAMTKARELNEQDVRDQAYAINL